MAEESLEFLQAEVRRLTTENRELRQELYALRETVRSLAAVYALTQEITPATDIGSLLNSILDAALAVLKASDGSLMLIDESSGELIFAVVRGEAADRLVGYRLPKGAGIAGWVATHRQPQIVTDVRRDPRFYVEVDEALGFKTRSMICVPVCVEDNRLLGVIEVLNKAGDREFTQDDLNLMLITSQLAAIAMRRAERIIEEHERAERRVSILQARTTVK